jgi:lipopolysaccharide transport system ATP-binding protein
MSDIVIRVDSLGKKYRIGGKQEGYRTLRDTLTETFVSPFRRARKLLRGHAYGAAELDETIWALKDVSLEVKRGEVVGIIGRNGAGKTTLLKILSRITEPTEGYAEIHGRVGSLLEVGTGFHPELSGRENIYLNGAILGMRKAEIERKFDEMVAFAEIEKFVDTPVKRYSSGMYVRLAFAVAAHLEPEILLVDEVLAVGDVAFQKKCLGKMGEVAKEGRTVLFVSHNMTAVQYLCGRSILLDRGEVISDGPATQVVDRYLLSARPTGVQSHPGEYILTHRKNDYLPDGDLIIRRLCLLDSQGNPQDTFVIGHEMHIAIDVQGLSEHRDALIGVIFKSNNDQWITSINTGMKCSPIDQPRQKNERAILRVPKLPFTPGTYWIDISVAQRGTGRLDYVEHAASFAVAEADIYGTGYKVSRYYGLVYLEAIWEITSSDCQLSSSTKQVMKK